MKPNAILFAAVACFYISSCKKEDVQKPIYPREFAQTSLLNKEKLQPEAELSDKLAYPVNYLRIGNYWIYKIVNIYSNSSSGTYSEIKTENTDSAAVTGFKLNLSGDTLFRITHYYSNATQILEEYFQINADGVLKDEAGSIVYNFASLPETSPEDSERKGCGYWTWTNFQLLDTIVNFETECCVLPAGLYLSHGETEFCGPAISGNKSILVVRGIGMVKNEYYRHYPALFVNHDITELIKFKVQR